MLPDMSTHHLILGGDFNRWLDPKLDCISPKACAPSKLAKLINSFLNEFLVSGVWGILNSTKKEYSFFFLLNVHHTFTRIDYFLVDNRLLSSVRDCSYDAILISDHAPVTVKIYFQSSTDSQPPLRFSRSLLSNEDFVGYISRH